MKNEDLGSKKISGKQNSNEGIIGRSNDKYPGPPELTPEIEIDTEGKEKIVQRARHIDGDIPITPLETSKSEKEKNSDTKD